MCTGHRSGTQGQGDQCGPSRVLDTGFHTGDSINYEGIVASTFLARGFRVTGTRNEDFILYGQTVQLVRDCCALGGDAVLDTDESPAVNRGSGNNHLALAAVDYPIRLTFHPRPPAGAPRPGPATSGAGNSVFRWPVPRSIKTPVAVLYLSLAVCRWLRVHCEGFSRR